MVLKDSLTTSLSLQQLPLVQLLLQHWIVLEYADNTIAERIIPQYLSVPTTPQPERQVDHAN
jgi:hypothetical protein